MGDLWVYLTFNYGMKKGNYLNLIIHIVNGIPLSPLVEKTIIWTEGDAENESLLLLLGAYFFI